MFYGEESASNLIVDGGQRQIVFEMFGHDRNLGGSASDIETALQIASYNNMNVGTWQTDTLSEEHIVLINNELVAGRWVVASVVHSDTLSGGHAIVIQNYNATLQQYTYWDPWTNNTGIFYKSDLITDTILLEDYEYRKIRYVIYCN